MEHLRIKKMVAAALMAALTCVATMVIQVPSPMGGYVNCGDAIVLLSAFFLGPVWGAAAAGIGSAMADALSGYLSYAPATFLIKAVMALAAAALMGHVKLPAALRAILSGIAAEAIMVLGYFCYESLILGYGAGAAAGIVGNCIQGVFGIAASTLLFLILSRVPSFQGLTPKH